MTPRQHGSKIRRRLAPRLLSLCMLACLSAASAAGTLTFHGSFEYWYEDVMFDAGLGAYTATAHAGSSSTFWLDVSSDTAYDLDFLLARPATQAGETISPWWYETSEDYSHVNIFGSIPGGIVLAPGRFRLQPRPMEMSGDLGDWGHVAYWLESPVYPLDEIVPFTLTLSWDDGTAVPEPGVSLLLMGGLGALAAGRRRGGSGR